MDKMASGAFRDRAPAMSLRSGMGATAATATRVTLDHGLTVGRQALPGQVVLDHPNVSRRHAAFEVTDGAVVLRELGGSNGTYVNGERLRGARALVQGDRIDIGPFRLTFDGTALTRVRQIGVANLLVRTVSYDVAGGGRILHAASLAVHPSGFVCIIGSNGAGKSTLMNIMAGRTRPTEGAVLLNGIDLHRNFDALKRDIAFVPQQDVLHEQLTLRQALDYAAQLRLPPETTRAQRHEAVHEAARAVDLLDRLDQRIGALSGGQKKCASLAAEILNQPALLFLDEVTSGLDETADWEIMRLLRRLADAGMIVVVVTHTLANVAEFADQVVCMGRGGQPSFIGTPAEVLSFFAVRRLGEVFARLDAHGAVYWRTRFEQGVATGVGRPTPVSASADPAQSRPPARRGVPAEARRMARQGRILLHRNVRLLAADHRTLTMAAVQSVLIGALIGYAFSRFGTGAERIAAEMALLLLLGLSAIWLGCNAASKEIVGELAIFRRERDIGLSTAAFIGAKYLVAGAFTVVQLAVVYGLVCLLAQRIPGSRLEQFALLTAGAMAGTAIGLLISALANTPDQATTIVPLALVPQLVLAGVLVPKVPHLAASLAGVAVSGYWLTEAMKSVFIAAAGPIRVIDAHTGALTVMTAAPAVRGAAIILAQAVGFLLLAYLVARLRHAGRGRHQYM